MVKGKNKYYKNLKSGAMVLLRDENLPSMRWKVGRITEFHPEKDGLTRVVSVKTNNGIVKRSITKVCLLAVDY